MTEVGQNQEEATRSKVNKLKDRNPLLVPKSIIYQIYLEKLLQREAPLYS